MSSAAWSRRPARAHSCDTPIDSTGGGDAMNGSPAQYRHEAFNAAEAIRERHFTTEALEVAVRDLAGYVVDLADRLALYEAVAHTAWHLMDDSGEVPDSP